MTKPTHEFNDGNDYPGGAERACLPAHIGGYQHLSPDVATLPDDILVAAGAPRQFCGTWAPDAAGQITRFTNMNVYRKIPVAKQGDNDDTGWKKVAAEVYAHEAKTEAQHVAPLPADAASRKRVPIYSGVIRYFPRAIAAIAHLSQVGNDQHNPGQPLHWDRSKSRDELDALMRHLLEADGVDKDGVPHIVKCAWRACAAAEKYLEKQEGNQ